jgi:hypothetical protein
MPSSPLKPLDLEATPILCFAMTRLDDSVTVSVYSVPENEPEPYETETLFPVLVEVEVLT